MPAKCSPFVWLFAFFCLTPLAAQTYETPEAAQADPSYAIQGEYMRPRDGMGAQLIATGGGEFQLVLLTGGLPGAGWNGSQKQELTVDADEAGDILEDFKKVERVSPTLGLSAPEGATVLFDGTRETFAAHWEQPASKMTDDGLLMEGARSIDRFRDYSMHVEFRTPFEPADRGQGRGNSGVYHQGRHEVQVLDSFGLSGEQNEAGGLYGVRKPLLNMCLPPLTWQTYDFDFIAAKFVDGEKVRPARITVRLNGVVVQRDVELLESSGGSQMPDTDEAGFLFLQNHGDPVRFRNIWVQPRDFTALAKRPIIPGFERFHAEPGGDAVEGGRVLIGELNCLSCHQASSQLTQFLAPRQAPVLNDVGERLHPDWMLDFISRPHAVKAGTTMPDMMAGMTDAERRDAAESLVAFLVGEKSLVMGGETGDVKKGQKLFHEVGCVACHQTRDENSVNASTSVPLADLAAKYSFVSLDRFLKNPAAVRPSSRMPHIALEDRLARDLVQFLIGDSGARWIDVSGAERPKSANLRYQVFHREFQKLPDFDEFTPDLTGDVAGFEIAVAKRENGFAIVYEGYLPINAAGRYTFRTKSDDGSALFIDGKIIVSNDGIHPAQVVQGTVKLKAGVHAVRVEYFEGGGEEELSVDWAGPDLKGRPLDGSLYLTRAAAVEALSIVPNAQASMALGADDFTINPAKAAKGRAFFASLGCASCHEKQTADGQRIVSVLKGPELRKCRPGQGCLSSEHLDVVADRDQRTGRIPVFDLAPIQVKAIHAALIAGDVNDMSAGTQLKHTMKVFNCYACHQRDGIGGPETDRKPLFTTTIPEMGDEGRLPPTLTGVGDKLNAAYLKKVIAQGANERAYMKSQMPKFGDHVAQELSTAFAQRDQRTGPTIPEVQIPSNRLEATGRQLAGDKGLSCVKCHTYGKFKASGIQAIGMDRMADRLREDWFHRYMIDPGKLRPGTRMPTAFPNGKSVVPSILDGDPQQQLAAIWSWLKKGDAGGVPEGITGGMIEIKPVDRPIIYRNFLEGLSSRGIAVGYPEKAHLAWDAERLSLAQLWQGRFMDGSLHWQGRGQGRQRPLGGNVLNWETTVPIAVLTSVDAPWPTAEPREQGYRFSGYRLDAVGRPTFRYRTRAFAVEETPAPVVEDGFPHFVRRLQVTEEVDDRLPAQPNGQLYFRAISHADVQQNDDGTWQVGENVRIRIRSTAAAIERSSEGLSEVLIPIRPGQSIQQEIRW